MDGLILVMDTQVVCASVCHLLTGHPCRRRGGEGGRSFFHISSDLHFQFSPKCLLLLFKKDNSLCLRVSISAVRAMICESYSYGALHFFQLYKDVVLVEGHFHQLLLCAILLTVHVGILLGFHVGLEDGITHTIVGNAQVGHYTFSQLPAILECFLLEFDTLIKLVFVVIHFSHVFIQQSIISSLGWSWL